MTRCTGFKRPTLDIGSHLLLLHNQDSNHLSPEQLGEQGDGFVLTIRTRSVRRPCQTGGVCSVKRKLNVDGTKEPSENLVEKLINLKGDSRNLSRHVYD